MGLIKSFHSLMQMLVDDIGDVTVTNDGATILKLLEVQHPAAKVCSVLPGWGYLGLGTGMWG